MPGADIWAGRRSVKRKLFRSLCRGLPRLGLRAADAASGQKNLALALIADAPQSRFCFAAGAS